MVSAGIMAGPSKRRRSAPDNTAAATTIARQADETFDCRAESLRNLATRLAQDSHAALNSCSFRARPMQLGFTEASQ
jgi:hypothetical protein